MASRSVLRSTLVLSRAHLFLRHNNNKPSLSNPLFQDLSLETLKPFSSPSSSSSFTISNHNLFFSHSRSFSSSFQYPFKFGRPVNYVELDSSSAISQGETVKRKPGRPRKIRLDDETSQLSLESSTPSSLSSLSQTQKRGRGRPPGSGKKKEVELESSPVSSPPSLSLLQTQKRGRGRPPGSGKKKEVELESSPVSSPPSLSLSQTQKRGRGRPPGSGKKKEVELESSPVSSPPSSSLSQTQKRGRGRPPGSGKKNEMLKQQFLKEPEQEQGEQQWLKNQREDRKHLTNFQRAFFESMAIVARSNNQLNPWEDFLKVKNKRDLPDLDISFCYLDEDCLIIE